MHFSAKYQNVNFLGILEKNAKRLKTTQSPILWGFGWFFVCSEKLWAVLNLNGRQHVAR